MPKSYESSVCKAFRNYKNKQRTAVDQCGLQALSKVNCAGTQNRPRMLRVWPYARCGFRRYIQASAPVDLASFEADC